jgi:hypothetical protein
MLNSVCTSYILSILVGVYAYKNWELPAVITNLFKNDIFRLVFLSLFIIPVIMKSYQIAVILAIFYMLTMIYIDINDTDENLALTETFLSV